MNYPAIVLNYFHHPVNAGVFCDNEADVFTGKVGVPANGDVVQLQLQIKNNKITAAKFKCYGNPYTMAAASYATELLLDKTIDEANNIRHTNFVEALEFPQVKVHGSLLVEDAIKAAIKVYQEQKRVIEKEEASHV